jgi:hypothetical protein
MGHRVLVVRQTLMGIVFRFGGFEKSVIMHRLEEEKKGSAVRYACIRKTRILTTQDLTNVATLQ